MSGKPFLIIFHTTLMARALTGGVSCIVAQAAPCPPRACHPPGTAIAFGRAVAEEESASMAHAARGGVGRVARWSTR